MAETLGSLCDKLTIIKLKKWHSKDPKQVASLGRQEKELRKEIDGFLNDALASDIALKRLRQPANKVFKNKKSGALSLDKNIGAVFSKLAEINCELWHIQEKVYDFESVPAFMKNVVIRKLAALNLSRNICIEKIDSEFHSLVKRRRR